MDAKTLLDENRSFFQANRDIAPSRVISYIPEATRIVASYNAFIGQGLFNKVEKEDIGRFQSFGGVPLTVSPKVDDVIQYDGINWKVVRYTKMGNAYTVYCENKLHNGKPK